MLHGGSGGITQNFGRKDKNWVKILQHGRRNKYSTFHPDSAKWLNCLCNNTCMLEVNNA